MKTPKWTTDLELELRDLLDGFIDENLMPAQMARIEELVNQYPEATTIYRNAIELEALTYLAADEQLAPGLSSKNENGVSEARNRSNALRLLTLAASVLALATIAWMWFGNRDSNSGGAIASIDSPTDADWKNAIPKQGFIAGEYELVAGTANLSFPCGAKVDVTAPAKFILNGPEEIELLRGSVSTNVPPSAVGFTVHAPNTAYVDLGTRATISVSEDQTSSVQVDEGLVKISVRREDGVEVQSETIPAGHGRNVDRSGVILPTLERVHTLPEDESHLIIQAESAAVSPGLNQSFVPVYSDGATGKEKLNSLMASKDEVTGIRQQTNFSVHPGEAISYQVRFKKTGRYYFHLRYRAPDQESNTIFAAQNKADKTFVFDKEAHQNLLTPVSGTNWTWVTFGAIEVKDYNRHSFSLGPREAGLIIDAIVFSDQAENNALYELWDQSLGANN